MGIENKKNKKDVIWFKRISKVIFYLVFCFSVLPAVCSANVGSPIMILYAGVWFFGWVQFAIIPIEAVVIKKLLTDKQKALAISWRQAFISSVTANLVTSAMGLPLLWVFSYVFYIPFFLPVLRIYGNGMLAYVAVISAIFLFISFILSVLIESLIVSKFFSGTDKISLKKAVFKANVASYAFLVILIIASIIYSQTRTLLYINEHYKTPSGDFSLDSEVNEGREFACFLPEINTDSGVIKCGGKEVSRWVCNPDGKFHSSIQKSMSAFGVTLFWVSCIKKN